MPDFQGLDSVVKDTNTGNTVAPVNPAFTPSTPYNASVDRRDNLSGIDNFLNSFSANSKFTDTPMSISSKEIQDNKRYNTYNPTVGNQEDYHAEGQSGWDRGANATWQFANKFGSYLTQTVGMVGGALPALVGGVINLTNEALGGDGKVVNDGHAIGLMTDNFLDQLSDVWKEKVQETNPIYKTNKYTNGSIWDKLSTTSWWLDDAVDRAALTAAMFVPGMLEAKGVGLFGVAAKAGGELEATGVASKALKAMADNPDMYGKLGKVLSNAVYKAATTGEVDLAGEAAMNFKNIIRGGQYAELASINTIGQNALNGRESQVAIRKALQEQKEKGLINLSNDEIEEKAAQGAIESFWYNMPLTLMSSLFELPQVFSSMKGGQNFLKNSLTTLKNDGIDAALTEAKAEVLKPGMWKTAGKALLTGFEHGQLESSQVAIGRYVEEAIAGKIVNGKVEKDENNPLLGSIKDYIGNFQDPNGQNNIALGTVQGLITTIFGHGYKGFKGEYKAEQTAKDNFITHLQDAITQRRFFNSATSDLIEKNVDGSVKLNDKGKPVYNQQKLAQFVGTFVDHVKNQEDRIKAINDGDTTFIENQNFNSLAALSRDFFSDANGKEYLTNVLRFEHKNQQTQQKSENRVNDSENGVDLNPDVLLQRNLAYVDQLHRAYTAIDQRHAGFLNLEVNKDDKDEVDLAQQFTELHKDVQYKSAAQQIFLNDKLQRNQTELLSTGISEKIENPSSPAEVRANEIIDENKNIEERLAEQKAVYRASVNRDAINTTWAIQKQSIVKAKEVVENTLTKQAEDERQAANPVKATIKIKTKDGNEELEIGTPYFLGRVVENDKDGNEVYRFPQLTIVGENPNGTIKIKGVDGIEKDVSKELLADYKLGKVSDTLSNKTANFYLKHINDVYQYNFGKDFGGKVRGRLEFDSKQNKLFFVYKDGKGKIKYKEVDNTHFTPQGNFADARLKRLATLKAETPAQKAAREEFTSKEEVEKTKANIEGKIAERRRIIKEVSDETKENIKKIDDKIVEKKAELEKLNAELSELGEFRKKDKYSNTSIVVPFNKILRTSMKGLTKLNGLKTNLENEISDLQSQKDELEFNISYFEDFLSNLNEMPEKLSGMINELKSQISGLENLSLETGNQINSFTKLIKSIENTIKELGELLHSAISKFDKDYPQPIRQSFEKMLEGGLLNETNFFSSIKEYVTDLALTEDTKKEININKDKINSLDDNIKDLYKQLNEIDKVQRAKEVILKTFEKAIIEEQERIANESKIQHELETINKVFGNTAKQDQIVDDTTIEKSEDENFYNNSNKKVIANIASTTDPSGENGFAAQSESHKRHNFFLNNVDTLPNRSDIKMMVVNKANEESLGLKGVVDKSIEHIEEKSRQPQNVALAVYIENGTDGKFFVDKNGKRLGKVGEQANLDEVIFSTMASDSVTNSKDASRFSETDTTLLGKWTTWYKGLRDKWLGAKEPSSYDFVVSQGLPNRYTTDEKNAVTANLISTEQLGQKGLIQISKNGNISVGGKSKKFTSGRVLLVNGNNASFLNNRNITKEEAENIYNCFVNLASTEAGEKWNNSVVTYLKSILFFGDPTRGTNPKEAGRNQFWVGQDGKLYIGKNKESFDFSPKALQENKDIMIAVLQAAYHNVNDSILQKGEEFSEIIGFNKEGLPTTRTWKSYQHYLLSDKYELVSSLDTEGINGKSRGSVDNIPLTDNLYKKDETSLTGAYKQKYSTIVPSEDEVYKEPIVPKAAPIATQAPVAKQTATPAVQQPATIQTGETEIKSFANNSIFDIPALASQEVANTFFDENFKKFKGWSYGREFTNLPQHLEETGEVHPYYAKYLTTIAKERGFSEYELIALQTMKKAVDIKIDNKIKQEEKTPTEEAEIVVPEFLQKKESSPISELQNKRAVIEKNREQDLYDFKNQKSDGYNMYDDKALSTMYDNRWKDYFKGIEQFPGTVQFTEVIKRINDKYDEELFKLVPELKEKKARIEKDRAEYLDELKTLSYSDAKNSSKFKPYYDIDDIKDIKDEYIQYKEVKRAINQKYDIQLEDLRQIVDNEANIEVPDFLQNRPNNNLTANKVVSELDVPRINEEEWNAFTQWMKANLPQTSVNRVNHLLKVLGSDKLAWGQFSKDGITLYKAAAKGTEYHEAFENVWNQYLTVKEQYQIWKEFRQREGSFTNEEGEAVNFGNATLSEAKEQIADEFSDYTKNRKAPAPVKGTLNKIIGFIRDLYNTLKSLFSTKITKNQLFEKINTAKFANAESVREFNGTANSTIKGFTTLQTRELMEDMAGNVAFVLLGDKDNNGFYYNFEKVNVNDLYSKVRELSLDHISNYVQALQEKLKSTNAAEYAVVAQSLRRAIEVGKAIHDENTWNEAISINREFLRSAFKIRITDEVSIDEQENKGKNDYMKNDFLIDTKANSSAAIKLLFNTLIQVKKNGEKEESNSLIPKPDENSFGGIKLLNSAKSFIEVMNNLSNTNTLQEMLSKLYTLSQNNPDYVRLYKRLKGDLSQAGELNYDNMKFNDWRLLMDFYVTFAKQSPSPYIVYNNSGGETYFQPADINSLTNWKINNWVSNLRRIARKGNKYIKKENVGKLTGYTIKVTDNTIFTGANDKSIIKDKLIPILNMLGVDIDTKLVNKLSDTDAKRLRESAEKFLKYIDVKKQTNIVKENLASTGHLADMAEIILRNEDTELKSTFFNIENKQQQVYVNDNHFSKFVNSFNTAKTLDEFIQENPKYQDTFSANSVILQKGGVYFNEEGKRTDVKLSVGYVNGLLTEKGKAKDISKLTTSERLMSTINSMINGWKNVIMPSDSSTEWMINFKNHFSMNDLGTDVFTKKLSVAFNGYLEDEINLILQTPNRVFNLFRSKNTNGLRLLDGVLSDSFKEKIDKFIKTKPSAQEVKDFIKANSDTVIADVNKFLDKEAELVKKVLTKEGKLSSYIDGKNNLVNAITGIDTKFARDNDFAVTRESEEDRISVRASQKQLDNLMKFITSNFVVNSIELHKLMLGDPNAFKSTTDELKRIKSFGSPAKSMASGEAINKGLDRLKNVVGQVRLSPDDYGYTNFDDIANTYTLSDFNVVGLPALEGNKDYNEVDRSDAQMWAMPTFYRESLIKTGLWSDEAEQFFQYDSAMFRQWYSSVDKKYGESYNANKELVAADKKIIENGAGTAKMNVLKPIIRGQKTGVDYIDTALDKTSTFPMFFTFTDENSHMREHMVQNFKQGMDYSIVLTGRKVGAQALHNFYNTDGTVNKNNIAEDSKFQIPSTNMSIQVETAYHESEGGVRGTQATKMSTMNTTDAGVPVDYKGTFDDWNKLSDEEKIKQSPLYKEVKNNEELLKLMANHDYNSFLHKLSLVDTGEQFIIDNPAKLHETLYNEISRLDANENVLNTVKYDKLTGKFNIAFEASNNYQRIKNVLLSIVDRNIISPKMNGGSKIQVSSAFFDNDKTIHPYIKVNNKWEEVKDYDKLSEKDKKNVRLFSDKLKFYRKDENGKTLPMQVLLPHWFGQKLRNTGKSDTEILEMLNSTEEGKDILQGIGFRIPTQEVNSIDVFEVAGFLPQQAGDSVVVPSELTKKSGSDFDVDKLNTYLKNIYVDSKGKLKAIESYKKDTGMKSVDNKAEEVFFDILQSKMDREQGKKVKYGNLQDLVGKIALNQTTEKTSNKWIPILKNMFGDDLDVVEIEDVLMRKLQKVGANLKELNDWDIQEALLSKFKDEYYRKALQNAYIDSMKALLLHEVNYDRLLKPNDNNGLEKLRDTLNDMLGLDKETSTSPLLSMSYINNQRQLSILGKSSVGIGAIAQANHSLTQRTPVYIDTERIKRTYPEDVKFLGDGNILLEHNNVRIGDNSFTTISSVLDRAKKYITDKVSAYINGFVDIAKDPFIVELGVTPTTAGTYLFLERIGVPTEKVMWFMNQPIIREYTNMLNSMGSTYLYNKQNIVSILDDFDSNGIEATEINESELKNNIERFYKNENKGDSKFKDIDNAQQQLIFTEFLKYSKMANHLREYTQALTWDTANFSDFILIEAKRILADNVEKYNIFNSPNEVLNNSFLGNLKDRITDASNSLSAVLSLQKTKAKEQILKVLEPLINPRNNFITTDEMIKLGNKVTASFTDYIIQTKGRVEGSPINSLISKFLINESTDVAHKIDVIKANKNNPLNYNYAFQQLTSMIGNHAGEVDNVKVVLKNRDSFTENQFINSLRELKAQDKGLYQYLVMSSVLQSGTYKSPISFTDLIPLEDYAAIVNPLINNLDNVGEVSNFADNNLFLRNQWQDVDLVPQIPEIRKSKAGTWYNQIALHPYHDKVIIDYLATQGMTGFNLPIYVSDYNAKAEIITVKRNNTQDFTSDEIAEMKAKKDWSYKIVCGYQLVKDENGVPLQIQQVGKDGTVYEKYIYKPINLYGDGQYLQEYYDDVRQSVAHNGSMKIHEATDNDIFFEAFKNSSVSMQIEEETNNNSIINFQEEQSSGYRERTIKNASADATIALAVDFNSAGEKLTKTSVISQKKKYIPIDANNLTVTNERVNNIVNDLNAANAKSLNIAGNGIYTMKGKYTQEQIDKFTYNLLKAVIESPNLKTKITSIRTGGQTGFDEAGAKAAIKLGMPTTILAPKGYTFRNINGQDISNEQQFKNRFNNSMKLKDGKEYTSDKINSKMLEELKYTPEEIGKILKSIC